MPNKYLPHIAIVQLILAINFILPVHIWHVCDHGHEEEHIHAHTDGIESADEGHDCLLCDVEFTQVFASQTTIIVPPKFQTSLQLTIPYLSPKLSFSGFNSLRAPPSSS